MKKLIFVYNAKGGFWNGAMDSAHKILSPKTYDCQLCSVTFGTFGMKKEWGKYLDSLKDVGIEIEFLHKDEKEQMGIVVNELPAILFVEDTTTSVLVNAKELNDVKTIQDMMKVINSKLPTD